MTLPLVLILPLGWTSPPVQMNADDVRRVAELGAEMQREEAALSQLKAQMAGLEEQAAELQRKIDGAGEQGGACTASFGCLLPPHHQRLALL